MQSESEAPRISPQRPSESDGIRRRVVQAAYEARRPDNYSDQAELDLYLALLQDRLPVYVSTMSTLRERVGNGPVDGTLLLITRASMEFYKEILAAKVAVFTRPEQFAKLRRTLQSNDLGPHMAAEAVARYLAAERDLGRVAPDVEPLAVARLLLGACLNYTFTTLLLGGDPPDPDDYAAELVRGLRLAPCPPAA